MKLSAKPISSPVRMEKFPPPLMRFLKTNAANKSRGRSKSRSNSMFLILRKKNTTSIETKEPSSPKVTCMGQVRVKRSSKQTTVKKGRPFSVSGDGAPTKCRCRFWWVPHTLFCCQSVKTDSECCFGFRRKGKASKVSEASMKNGSKESHREEEQEQELEEEEENNRVVNTKAFVCNDSSSFSSTPPKNALLLTRCKSAPYSSSSLASRFWGSPLRTEETEQPSEVKQSESVSVSKLKFFKELEDSVRERITESERVRELKRKEEGESVAFPLVLTRCKSERARKI